MSHNTTAFLAAVGEKAKALILGSIARHYGRSAEEIYVEVTDPDAHHLLDYMVEPDRGATSALMQRHGMR
ncbi:hypothetical protein [Pseudomonas sp. EMN2]|uniref:hypothetical protein n=1 Tax=Pseudomonas sp. EMN2 TaxID=2615212 RepID=UPI00129A8539|nr:hypothetical protein [Pseudomonas sp. EMN2]